MARHLTIMENHFVDWYEENERSFFVKIHRIIRPNCPHCKRNDLAYEELCDAVSEEGE